MKTKLVAAAVVVLVLSAAAAVAWRAGWLSALGQRTGMTREDASPAAGAQAAGPAGETPTGNAGNPPPSAESAAASVAPAFDGNVASLEWGGRLEKAPGAEVKLLSDENEGDATWASGNVPGPKEIVVSFFERDVALVDSVVIENAVDHPGAETAQLPEYAPRDVEVWTSTTSADGGFARVAGESVPAAGQVVVRFPAVEARFVKLRLLRNHANGEEFHVRRVKVMEAQGGGYTSLFARHPELLGPWAPAPGAQASGSPAPIGQGCAVAAPAMPSPGRGESHRILLLSSSADIDPSTFFPALQLKDGPKERLASFPEFAIAARLETRTVKPVRAQLFMLSESAGIDTVVLMQPCAGYPMSAAFRQALVKWVAAGHKLIIHDSDKCVPGPDYGWLPFDIKTDTPGARGEPGGDLKILEDNWIAQSRPGRDGFIDTGAWASLDPPANELGDSNVVTAWDANWCGHMVVRNVQNVFGFVHAYAHYGRGLIIWSGLDVDMSGSDWYDRLVMREFGQGFAPDNLPCSIHVGHFVVSTDSRHLSRGVAPGRSYTYPLTLLSNMKYRGRVTLSASPVGGGAVEASFEPPVVDVSGIHQASLRVTLPAAPPIRPFALEVKGTDAEGRTNSLCLQLGPVQGGELSVVSALAPATKTSRNLEIILDASGSMKTPLAGKKTRWDVALETLQQVLGRLPDDFNVGLRIYGHREASRSPATCTDSELIVPVQKLDRAGILDRARSFKPKGETPLVYSALQARDDLRGVGGGTVILITDGEESCKGDPVKAAADLEASGLDIRLNIVGFALKNPRVQQDLAGFSQSTGGLFYAADSGPALADAVMVAAVEKFPYVVYDGTGKAVVTGEAGSGSDTLPAGEYRVVVKAGAKELVAPRVSVGLGQSVTLTIAMKAGQLVLQ
jgi:hypothetical protein